MTLERPLFKLHHMGNTIHILLLNLKRRRYTSCMVWPQAYGQRAASCGLRVGIGCNEPGTLLARNWDLTAKTTRSSKLLLQCREGCRVGPLRPD
ncbi:hypothetical protein AVEN_265408-1 [Araneus ventricosus]|uniref:Uncharacterized protein n=1 Tax=Araneus ventricosus TaxID=182803 RepID=A0A4Y2MK21_ARAVE|nr:hypothetical protein AVEN_265408-1 [Araneus ventricosus]